MERYILDIYAYDFENPTVVVTYTKDHERGNIITSYGVWVKESKSKDFEVMNVANQLLRQAFIYNRGVTTSHTINATYQNLFYDKNWLPSKEHTENLPTLKLCEDKVPYLDFVRFTENTMQDFTEHQTLKYIKQAVEKG